MLTGGGVYVLGATVGILLFMKIKILQRHVICIFKRELTGSRYRIGWSWSDVTVCCYCMLLLYVVSCENPAVTERGLPCLT